MNKILKLIVSILFFLSTFLPGLAGLIDTVSISLTGMPYYSLATSSGFLDEITDSSIIQLDENAGYVKNILLVFVDEGASLLQRYQALKSIGGVCIGYLEPANLFVVRTIFNGPEEMKTLCENLSQKDGVLFASGSYAFKNNENFTPNDPFDGLNEGRDIWDETNARGGTWWLEAIDARNAWGYSPYFNAVKVGIVDSGFDTAHPDLAGKITFPSNMLAKQNIPGAHGTHVAGIIGANGNNGIGISGITQNSTLVCVDWQAEEGQLWVSDLRIVFGVGYAVKAGAKVVNLSVGSSSNVPEGKPAYPKLWMDAEGALVSAYMSILFNRGFDFVVVQSAGNGDSKGNPIDAFNNGSFTCITRENCMSALFGVPAEAVLGRIIIAGSARTLGNGNFIQSGFSNVGDQVSICAPGSSLFSCTTAENGSYQYMSGTSMAAPVVTGVASLVWSVNPELTGLQVKSIVCDEANTRYNVPETNDKFWVSVPYRSYRMVNAQLAVEAAVKTLYDTCTVTGRAVDGNGNPKDCEITAVSDGRTFRFSSGLDGTFRFLLPPGAIQLTFEAPGPLQAQTAFDTAENETMALGDVALI